MSVDRIARPPPFCTPPPQVCRKWRALYRVKWVDSTQSYDLICDAPSELQLMVQLLHRQLVTTSFGDASALLVLPERTSLTGHLTRGYFLTALL